MGLKSFGVVCGVLVVFGLKSDQNGIEIKGIPAGLYASGAVLKSDQNGIEIALPWSVWVLVSSLKSDQNGIEIPWTGW